MLSFGSGHRNCMFCDFCWKKPRPHLFYSSCPGYCWMLFFGSSDIFAFFKVLSSMVARRPWAPLRHSWGLPQGVQGSYAWAKLPMLVCAAAEGLVLRPASSGHSTNCCNNCRILALAPIGSWPSHQMWLSFCIGIAFPGPRNTLSVTAPFCHFLFLF